jgi:hypothetical protein
VAGSSGGAQEKGNETQFTTKIDGKASLGPSYLVFVKFSFPVTHLMPYYAETGCSPPPNCETLQITLFYSEFYEKPSIQQLLLFLNINFLKKTWKWGGGFP